MVELIAVMIIHVMVPPSMVPLPTLAHLVLILSHIVTVQLTQKNSSYEFKFLLIVNADNFHIDKDAYSLGFSWMLV